VAKADTLEALPDSETRKPGEQTGLDTPVVLAVNGVHVGRMRIRPRIRVVDNSLNVHRLGSTVARLKLKEIDGGPHKRWSMWLNSMQREEPYLALTCISK
jgi:hypothetical protein